MRALLQRVSEAAVALAGAGEAETIAEIGPGLVVLLCTEDGDTEETAEYFARKIAHMRIFADENDKTNLSVLDVGGQALVVSQFTLAANWKKGNRPSFSGAADPETAERLWEYFCTKLAEEGVPVSKGRFRSHMRLALVNDGPVTIWMDSNEK